MKESSMLPFLQCQLLILLNLEVSLKLMNGELLSLVKDRYSHALRLEPLHSWVKKVYLVTFLYYS